MFKKLRKNEKGFTLAELLIVVAIIGVLVAISIPIFTSQLEKSRDAVSVANIRAAYAEAATEYMTGTDAGTAADVTKTCLVKGKQSGWSGLTSELTFDADKKLTDEMGGKTGTATIVFSFAADGTCKIKTFSVA